MNDRDKEMLLKQLSDDNLAYRYQSFINYVMDGSEKGMLDKTEYRVFVEQTLRKDIIALAHAHLQMLINFNDYYNKLTMVIGWDLIIQGIFDGKVSRKNNEEKKDIQETKEDK